MIRGGLIRLPVSPCCRIPPRESQIESRTKPPPAVKSQVISAAHFIGENLLVGQVLGLTAAGACKPTYDGIRNGLARCSRRSGAARRLVVCAGQRKGRDRGRARRLGWNAPKRRSLAPGAPGRRGTANPRLRAAK